MKNKDLNMNWWQMTSGYSKPFDPIKPPKLFDSEVKNPFFNLLGDIRLCFWILIIQRLKKIWNNLVWLIIKYWDWHSDREVKQKQLAGWGRTKGWYKRDKWLGRLL